MKKLKILFLGVNAGTARHRALALRRLGHEVSTIDPESFLPKGHLATAWNWHTGGLFLEDAMRRRILENLPRVDFNLVYVDGGQILGPSLIRELKNRFGTVVNYNVDDPYGRRDGLRWRLYLQSVPLYDLVVVVRDENVREAADQGARNVLRVHRSADEVAHAPRPISEEDRKQWASEVAFVGTWMPERGGFMARLVALGVPLTIYGDRWHRAREWETLRSSWRGPGLYDDDHYARAIQCAKVNLGLLSKGNRDLATQRSFEIPYLGGVLCAERTSEHRQLYTEDEEAVFWDSPEECAAQCLQLLRDEPRRKRLAISGRNRCLQNNTTNEAILTHILDTALEPQRASEAAPKQCALETNSSRPASLPSSPLA